MCSSLVAPATSVNAWCRLYSRGIIGCGCSLVLPRSRASRAAQTPSLGMPSVAAALRPGDTVVHLVGTPHPSPAKAKEFERVDLASIRAVVAAARGARIAHLVYVSVAHPAPVMHAYIAVRAAGERMISEAGLTATIVRPWYVLGPGHRWPLFLVPFYAAAELVPRLREGTRRLGLVTLDQMVRCLVRAVEGTPPSGTQRVVDVAGIRGLRIRSEN